MSHTKRARDIDATSPSVFLSQPTGALTAHQTALNPASIQEVAIGFDESRQI